MATNQTELLLELALQTNPIVIENDFLISQTVTISYNVTFVSGNGGPYILSRELAFSNYMFNIISNSSMQVSNLILDGDAINHPIGDTTNRSLIAVSGGSLFLEAGSLLRNNNAYLEGGGVYLRGSESAVNTLVMRGNARITNCYTRVTGGGIMVALRNNADSVTISEDALIDSNSAQFGGGVYFRSYVLGVSSNLNIGDNVQIANNMASSNGGGVYVSNFINGNTVPLSLTVTGNAVISQNNANNGAGVYVFATNVGDQYVQSGNAIFVENVANNNGGAGFLNFLSSSRANVLMTGGTIRENVANNASGGFQVTSAGGGTCDLSNVAFIDNSTNNSQAGGFYYANSSSEPSDIAMNAVVFEGNRAEGNGGGAILIGGPGLLTTTVINSTFTENVAGLLGSGGGIVINSTAVSTTQIIESMFMNNTATVDGGGIFFGQTANGNDQFSIESTTVVDNTATLDGGGIHFSAANGVLTASISNTNVSNNLSTNGNGGGVWIADPNANLMLSGATTITGNTSIQGNGGGIYYNATNGVLRATGPVVIQDNVANNNLQLASNNGGGIVVVAGSVIIEDSTQILNNYAGRYGGGIFIGVGVSVTAIGGTISGNIAGLIGGAVYISTGGTLTLIDASIIGVPTPNEAPIGPGIYNGGTLNISGVRNITNGLYIPSGANVAQIRGPLAGSAIQLNNTPYVMTNPEGIPITVAVATPEYPLLSQSDADAFLKPVTGFDGWEVRLNAERTAVEIAPAVYTITYENLQGGQSNNPQTYTIFDLPIVLNDPDPIPGLRFVGWRDADGNFITVIPEGTTGNLILYAVFENITPPVPPGPVVTGEQMISQSIRIRCCCPKPCSGCNQSPKA
ncbi:beta strand repeat-containing protein [Geomicrobium sediminis]|uniref:Right handed beta helix domain-containing protein n=1 Tax=Geomicrobium sediminis TaxID=1347788 RepID=A0ABS2PGD5_9BACL|nr:hypothetical protein [Geomicrobium sediminis]MBM7634141.1 hypothetical protein [Geomicrobium sediminis]